jgi:hypothetical protein
MLVYGIFMNPALATNMNKNGLIIMLVIHLILLLFMIIISLGMFGFYDWLGDIFVKIKRYFRKKQKGVNK